MPLLLTRTLQQLYWFISTNLQHVNVITKNISICQNIYMYSVNTY